MTVKSGTRAAKAKPTAAKAKPTATRAKPAARAPAPRTAAAPKPGKAKVRIFVSYCHANAVQQAKLQVHLAQLRRDEVEIWFDGEMEAGDKLNTEISRKLRAADVFVALMSPEYIASHWCQLEYRRAMGRRARGSMRVVVVIVRPCAWKDTGASDLKVLPRDGKAVSDWRSMDHAFANVAEGIKGAVKAVRAALQEAVPARPAKSTRAAAAPVPEKRPAPAKGGRKASTKARPAARAVLGKRPARGRAAG
ncbi:toll/interleukin-1 receptor domain-containing protein [Methylobacterium radiodurans]|uniref:toll/interleukin-1 receptor domain-containing protein n=1 Tax=Methylobacterium radiodurans TaxID=2202828 RepID=UPI001FE96D28|nr:toll/interleukin-1 receptor domain-containing protein [Methylobacterium radiodurans]